MARRFTKVVTPSILIASDGEVSGLESTIVVGSKWAVYVPDLLTEIEPDDTIPEESEPSAVNGLGVEAFTPAAAASPTNEAVGAGDGLEVTFTHTLASPPAARSSVVLSDSWLADKASLDCSTVSTLLDTVVEATAAGAAGNNLQLALINDGAPASNVTGAYVGDVLTLHYEVGVSTVLDVENYITGLAGAISVKTPGTAATVLDVGAGFVATNLTGGRDAGGGVRATDDGSGNLTGGTGPTLVTGTVNYETGAMSATFATAPLTGDSLTVAYDQVTKLTLAGLPLTLDPLKFSVVQNDTPVVQGTGAGKYLATAAQEVTLGTGANGTDIYVVSYLTKS